MDFHSNGKIWRNGRLHGTLAQQGFRNTNYDALNQISLHTVLRWVARVRQKTKAEGSLRSRCRVRKARRRVSASFADSGPAGFGDHARIQPGHLRGNSFSGASDSPRRHSFQVVSAPDGNTAVSHRRSSLLRSIRYIDHISSSCSRGFCQWTLTF